ncbi:uncharacterized protein NDAI_0E04830 [Naumovozyma dairenensis CBS 421]|uniref:Flo11 domain-containing protein n=1 Tax=Naumovozyma dairenensis (strain ATCC 10597 / BCRC 20456 / CBS 421 / NBRC 0211 / NRRL Y-12639) TaxID=1071378 RepID=G0WAM7_NAUDC|nr:hypothetical protein NDAI_0E04830 [Naumovozyma dairenensis CBS 421]CCD25300.1 hypothetical protein NDAI_0E04830 [Naumovozyma dairenensis CBS 421]
MLSSVLLIIIQATYVLSSLINYQDQSLWKRGTLTCQTVMNGCPDLNFGWHAANTNILKYYLDILNVEWLGNNLYEITIQVTGEEQIDLKYLYSLKIIGVQGPKSTIQLYGKNENTFLIDSPTNYTVTFQVYGGAKKDECNIWLPNFQIQYEYLQGDASKYQNTWKWGTTSFDLSTGCTNYDNQMNSQTDFPGFYWNMDCRNECGKSATLWRPSTVSSKVKSTAASIIIPTIDGSSTSTSDSSSFLSTFSQRNSVPVSDPLSSVDSVTSSREPLTSSNLPSTTRQLYVTSTITQYLSTVYNTYITYTTRSDITRVSIIIEIITSYEKLSNRPSITTATDV